MSLRTMAPYLAASVPHTKTFSAKVPSPDLSLRRTSPVTTDTESVVAPSSTVAVSADATGVSLVPLMLIFRD